MNTAPEPQVTTAVAEEEQPVLSFTRLIQCTPSTAAFGGWGPKVIGLTGSLSRWN